jgi:glycosyltransferase involved in cell wall biosynthesis
VVEYIGEIGEWDNGELLGGACALLFPIDWPEPFGLVMIEAMACGTPVVAYRCASVPDVIDVGVTGFIVDDVASAVAALGQLDRLDRRLVRARFEQRFTAERMASDYVAVYTSLAQVLDLPRVRRLPLANSEVPVMDGDELGAVTAA